MTGTSETERLMTAEELYALPDSGEKRELVNGRLRVSEPPGAPHGFVQARLTARLVAAVEAGRLGFVFVESGVVLRHGPDTVRGPDVWFVARERLRDGMPRAYFEGAPDLAVEVVSPRDAAAEMAEKVESYLDAGARIVWVVYPNTRSVAVHTPDGIVRTLRAGDTLDGGDVIPGFALALAELFAQP